MTTFSAPAAATDDVHELIGSRVSPRSFDPSYRIGEATLTALLEAARWAPSSMNGQPWRFVVARRGTSSHRRIMDALKPGNQVWAGEASVLVVAIAERERDGTRVTTADYDLGLAVAQMTMQAHSAGLHAHQMGGFEPDALHHSLDLDAALEAVVVVAIGRRDGAHRLPEHLRERETAPRTRRPLSELVLSVDGEPWAPIAGDAIDAGANDDAATQAA